MKKYDIQIIALHFSVVLHLVLILLSLVIINWRAFSAHYSILISTGKVSTGGTVFYVWLACACMGVANFPQAFWNSDGAGCGEMSLSSWAGVAHLAHHLLDPTSSPELTSGDPPRKHSLWPVPNWASSHAAGIIQARGGHGWILKTLTVLLHQAVLPSWSSAYRKH